MRWKEIVKLLMELLSSSMNVSIMPPILTMSMSVTSVVSSPLLTSKLTHLSVEAAATKLR